MATSCIILLVVLMAVAGCSKSEDGGTKKVEPEGAGKTQDPDDDRGRGQLSDGGADSKPGDKLGELADRVAKGSRRSSDSEGALFDLESGRIVLVYRGAFEGTMTAWVIDHGRTHDPAGIACPGRFPTTGSLSAGSCGGERPRR